MERGEGMTEYSWLAVDKKGNEKKGTMEARTDEVVYDSLKSEGLIPIRIRKQSVWTREINVSLEPKRIKSRELSVFCRQFVSIINAGIPIKRALQMLYEQTENKFLKNGIYEVMVKLESGSSLAEAMASQKKVFPSMLVNMVEAGESSGSLDVSFLRMASHFEKEARLKSMVKKATIYPVILVFVVIGVLAVMLTFVIPQFVTMFSSIDVEMPAVTRMVMEASDFTRRYWYVLLTMLLLILFGCKGFSATGKDRLMIDFLKMKLPVFGKLTVKTECSKMARTLGTLLAAGVPLVEALEITSRSLDNIHFKNAVLTAREEVMSGVPFSQPLTQSGIFPPVVWHMIGIGEDTGTMEEMMGKLADYYEEEVELATQSVMAALEPLIIVVMAVIVGFLVVSVILPLAALYDGLDSTAELLKLWETVL